MSSDATAEILRAQDVIAALVEAEDLDLPSRVEYQPAPSHTAMRGDGPGAPHVPVRTSVTLPALEPLHWLAWASALPPHSVHVKREHGDWARIILRLCTVHEGLDIHLSTVLTRDAHPDALRLPVQWNRGYGNRLGNEGRAAHRDVCEHVSALLAYAEEQRAAEEAHAAHAAMSAEAQQAWDSGVHW